MRMVTVRKDELLKNLEHNKEDHRALFEEAWEGYRHRVIEELERKLSDIKANRPIDVYIRLEPPQDHTKEYEQVIAMARMSVDETIQLTFQEFAQFVQDDWAWKQGFTANATSYLVE